jgi:hypothetical protein
MPQTARNNPDPETSHKYFETTLADLRKRYGPDFAKGYPDNEKLADAVKRQPALMEIIRRCERKWFEQI